MSAFDQLATDQVKLVKLNGSASGPYKAIVNGNKIEVFDETVPVDDGDTIIRLLPNGREENYRILDSQYSEALGPIPASYQLKVEKVGALRTGTAHSGGAVIKHTNHINVTGGNVQIGSGNQQTNSTTLNLTIGQIQSAIEQSNASAEQKQEAKSRLARFLEHPLTSTVVSALVSSVTSQK